MIKSRVSILIILLITSTLQKYDPSTIIKKGHIHQLHGSNIDFAINKYQLLFLFVYGDWCPHAKSMLQSYKDFSLYLKNQNSKLETGIYHLKSNKNFKYAKIIHNPTLLVFLKGKVVAKQFWMEDFNHALHIIEHKVMKKYDYEFVDYIDFTNYKIQRKKNSHSLLFVGKKANENFVKYLEFVYTKKNYDFRYFRIDPTGDYKDGEVYLYRQEDDVELIIDSFPNLDKSIKWLYHHSDPFLLRFPEPALTQILEHKNPGLMLFFKNKRDLLKKKNEKVESEFELVAEKLYKSFKITKCFIDEEIECKNLLTKTLKGTIKGEFPRLILAIQIYDFRSEILGIKYNKEINEQNILDFTNTFHDIDYPLEILTEKKTDNKYQITAETIFDEMHDNFENDRVIFYYRGILDEDNSLLEKYTDLIEEIEDNLQEKVFFYFYNVDENAVFDDFKNKNDFPAIRVFKKNHNLSFSKLYKSIQNFKEVLMFLNDQITLDNSEILMNYSQ